MAAFTAAASTTEAWPTLFARPCYVDRKVAPVYILTVNGGNGALRRIVVHFHEPEATRIAGELIHHHCRRMHGAVLLKQLPELVVAGVKTQIAYKDLRHAVLIGNCGPGCGAGTTESMTYQNATQQFYACVGIRRVRDRKNVAQRSTGELGTLQCCPWGKAEPKSTSADQRNSAIQSHTPKYTKKYRNLPAQADPLTPQLRLLLREARRDLLAAWKTLSRAG